MVTFPHCTVDTHGFLVTFLHRTLIATFHQYTLMVTFFQDTLMVLCFIVQVQCTVRTLSFTITLLETFLEKQGNYSYTATRVIYFS
jgi:hypothetical protein